MKHTKEPWEAKADPSYYGIVSEIYAMDKFVASLGGVCSPDEVEANARRIVACVNACAGITNEALEAGYIKHLVEWDEVNHKRAMIELYQQGQRKFYVTKERPNVDVGQILDLTAYKSRIPFKAKVISLGYKSAGKVWEYTLKTIREDV